MGEGRVGIEARQVAAQADSRTGCDQTHRCGDRRPVTPHGSLVGPRPLPVYEIERIEKHAQRRRLSVKPGLTCLWQVTGRNGIKIPLTRAERNGQTA